MSTIQHITDTTFGSLVEKAQLPVVIDVFATWCGPCQHMAPAFEELATQYAGTYTFLKLDVDEARALAIQFGITSVPTFLFFKAGRLVGSELGYMNKSELENKIKQHLS